LSPHRAILLSRKPHAASDRRFFRLADAGRAEHCGIAHLLAGMEAYRRAGRSRRLVAVLRDVVLRCGDARAPLPPRRSCFAARLCRGVDRSRAFWLASATVPGQSHHPRFPVWRFDRCTLEARARSPGLVRRLDPVARLRRALRFLLAGRAGKRGLRYGRDGITAARASLGHTRRSHRQRRARPGAASEKKMGRSLGFSRRRLLRHLSHPLAVAGDSQLATHRCGCETNTVVGATALRDWHRGRRGRPSLRRSATGPCDAKREGKASLARYQRDRPFLKRRGAYSTVTLLARLRGWSTSVPLATA